MPNKAAARSHSRKNETASSKRRKGSKAAAPVLSGEAGLAQGSFWTRKTSRPVFTKGDIDRRRKQQLVPGTRLEPTSADDIIPVVIIRHDSRSGSAAPSEPVLHGFTLLIPRGWGIAFWLSLVSPGTRVAGQVQIRHQALEGGALAFPHDYLGTAAFDDYWQQQALVRQREWKKRPKGKRTEWETLGLPFPYGGKEMWIRALQNSLNLSSRERRLHPLVHDTIIDQKSMPWILAIQPSIPASSWRKLARQVLLGEGEPMAEEVLATLQPLLPSTGERLTANDVSRLATAFVHVRVTACRRGTFDEMSPLFQVSRAQDMQWRSVLQAAAADGQQDHKAELQKLENGNVAAAKAVGAITSGSYSLTQGKGYAIGSISFLSFLETVLRDEEAETALPVPHRKGRNPITTNGLLISRDLGGPMLRAASCSLVTM